MQTKIISYSISRARKSEIPGFVRSLLTIVEKYNPTTLGVKTFYDTLEASASQLPQYVEPQRVKHPLSDSIKDTRKRRNVLVAAIVAQKVSVEKAKLSPLMDAGMLVFPLITKYLMGFGQNNVKSADDRLMNFINEVEGSETLKAAAVTLGVKIYIDELQSLQPVLVEKCDKRREEKSLRRIVDNAGIKADISTSITNLLKSIELATLQHPNVDYTSLIAELNELLVPYRALSRYRVTRSKNEAIKNETVAMSTTTSATAN